MESSLRTKEGIHLSPEGYQQCLEAAKEKIGKGEPNLAAIKVAALNFDFKHIAEACIPKNMGRAATNFYFKGKLCLQVASVRNVSESEARARKGNSAGVSDLVKLVLTDGHSTVQAVALEQLHGLSVSNTAPGSKVVISDCVVRNGYFCLKNQSIKVAGGHVVEMEEAWKADMYVYARRKNIKSADGGVPPSFPSLKELSQPRARTQTQKGAPSAAAPATAAGKKAHPQRPQPQQNVGSSSVSATHGQQQPKNAKGKEKEKEKERGKPQAVNQHQHQQAANGNSNAVRVQNPKGKENKEKGREREKESHREKGKGKEKEKTTATPVPQSQSKTNPHPHPNPQKPALTCHRCGQEGHFIRDCPQNVANANTNTSANKAQKDVGVAVAPDDRKCYVCGEIGHISHHCPKKKFSNSNTNTNAAAQQGQHSVNNRRNVNNGGGGATPAAKANVNPQSQSQSQDGNGNGSNNISKELMHATEQLKSQFQVQLLGRMLQSGHGLSFPYGVPAHFSDVNANVNSKANVNGQAVHGQQYYSNGSGSASQSQSQSGSVGANAAMKAKAVDSIGQQHDDHNHNHTDTDSPIDLSSNFEQDMTVTVNQTQTKTQTTNANVGTCKYGTKNLQMAKTKLLRQFPSASRNDVFPNRAMYVAIVVGMNLIPPKSEATTSSSEHGYDLQLTLTDTVTTVAANAGVEVFNSVFKMSPTDMTSIVKSSDGCRRVQIALESLYSSIMQNMRVFDINFLSDPTHAVDGGGGGGDGGVQCYVYGWTSMPDNVFRVVDGDGGEKQNHGYQQQQSVPGRGRGRGGTANANVNAGGYGVGGRGRGQGRGDNIGRGRGWRGRGGRGRGRGGRGRG